MYLDAASQVREVEPLAEIGSFPAKPSEVFDAWADWLPSRISHHGEECCEIAREWLSAADYSFLNGEHILTGPRWIARRFKWGPSSYPIDWCGAVRRERLDCGALAVLAGEAFRSRGVTCLQAQLVQRFSRVATRQWEHYWKDKGASVSWIDGDLIYHEGCAIETSAGEIKVWDASAGWWIDPRVTSGYGSVAAIRINGGERLSAFSWEGRRIVHDAWQSL